MSKSLFLSFSHPNRGLSWYSLNTSGTHHYVHLTHHHHHHLQNCKSNKRHVDQFDRSYSPASRPMKMKTVFKTNKNNTLIVQDFVILQLVSWLLENNFSSV